MEPKTLAQLSVGETAVVVELTQQGPLRRRLQDLGFTPGARVTALFESPAGDPVAYEVRGTVIDLRRADSARIRIEWTG